MTPTKRAKTDIDRETFEKSCEGELWRGALVFGTWNARHCNELVRWCDEDLDHSAFQAIEITQKYQAIEMST